VYYIVRDRTGCDLAKILANTSAVAHTNEYSWGVSVDTLIGMGGAGGWITHKFTCR